MTTANGAAMMIVMFWMPVSASPSPPPTMSMIAPIAPMTAPQKITTPRLGWMVPR